jgi:hypothetical protein
VFAAKVSAISRSQRERSSAQRAYEKRKWSRPAPIEALSNDLATTKVRDLIREEVRSILQEFGLIPNPPPPSTPKAPRQSPLRLVK